MTMLARGGLTRRRLGGRGLTVAHLGESGSAVEAADVPWLVLEVVACSAVAAGACGVALRLAWLTRTRARRLRRLGHLGPEDAEPYGSRRQAWLTIVSLVMLTTVVVCGVSGDRDSGKWAIPAVLLVIYIAAEVADRGRHAVTWRIGGKANRAYGHDNGS